MKQYRLLIHGRGGWLVAVLSLCLLASCGGNDNLPEHEGTTDSNVPIGFSSDIDSQNEETPSATRVGAVTSISSMRVFASYTKTADWTATDTPNFMYHQLMEKTDEGWTYSPLKYWPNATDEKISFFAYYAPEGTTGFSYSSADDKGLTFSYTLPAKESEQRDLLVSSCLNRTKATTTGGVKFRMQHVLTQVKFKAKNKKASTCEIRLQSLKASVPGSKGTLSFKTDTDNSFTWTFNPSDNPTTLTADARLQNTITLDDTPKEIATFFLLPVGSPYPVATLQLTYTVRKTLIAEEPITLTASVSLPATPEWEQGASITYTLSITDDRLEVEKVTSIADFTDGTTGVDGDITAT